MKLSRLALAVALLPSTQTFAETPSREAALKLEDTVISANRDAQARSESSAASSVFTRADIDRLQPSSVADLLQRVPGVQITRAGGPGSTVGLYIRGTKTAQSLVLVDGQRIGSASAGGSPLEYLSIEQIERVEVLRGSRSAIYGSDAIGGVVQITTRRAAGEGLTPLDTAQASEQARALNQCLGRLENKQREVVNLAYMRDLSHSELASQLQLPLGTVKTWIRRGLDQLRQCMARFA